MLQALSSLPKTHPFESEIRLALENHSIGTTSARLALSYCHAVKSFNAHLNRCAHLMGHGKAVDSYLAYYATPDLPESVKALKFSDLDAWKKRCEQMRWATPEALKLELAELFGDAFDSVDAMQETMLKEHRSHLQKNQLLKAYPIIRFLNERFPETASYRNEKERNHKQLLIELTSDLLISHGEATSQTGSIGVLRKYRASGMEIKPEPGPIETALEDEHRYLETESKKLNRKFTDKLQSDKSPAAWQSIESELWEATEGTGALLPEAFSETQERIAFLRDEHDARILIQDLLDQSQSGRSLSSSEKAALRKAAEAALAQKFDIAEKTIQRALELAPSEAPPKSVASKEPAKVPAPKKIDTPPKATRKLPLVPIIGGVAACIGIGAAVFLFTGSPSESPAPLAKADKPSLNTATQTPTPTPADKSEQPSAAETNQAQAEKAARETLKSIQELAAQAYSPSIETKIEELAATLKQPELQSQLKETLDTFASRKSEYVNSLTSQAKALLDTATASTQALEAKIGTASFDEAYRNAQDKLDAALAAIEKASALAPDVAQWDTLKYQSLAEEFRSRDASLRDLRQRINEATDLASYAAALQDLARADVLSEKESSQLARLAMLSSSIASPLENFASKAPVAENDESVARPLNAQENDLLNTLINNRAFSNVLLTTVKYYQGSTTPTSERQAFLSEWQDKIEKRSGRSLSVTFTTRQFDDAGRAAFRTQTSNYLENADGTVWGYYFEDPTRAPESIYYETTLNPALKAFAQEASPRRACQILRLMAEAPNASPFLRAYWIQRFSSALNLEPAKWGLRTSPTFQDFALALKQLAPEELPQNQWLAKNEDRTQEAFSQLLAATDFSAIEPEMTALRRLQNIASQSSLQLAGYVAPNGTHSLRPQFEHETKLWTIDPASGQLARLSDQPASPSYSPLLAYTLPDGDPQTVLARIQGESGINLSAAKYRQHLPNIFQE